MNNEVSKKETLIAATRVTGSVPHLGTFYGWVLPILKANRNMNVVVVISDYQSFDIKLNDKYHLVASQLRKNLRVFLPPEIPIIIESEIPSLPLLGMLISGAFDDSHLSRISTFKKLKTKGTVPHFNTLAYPAFMIADVLAVGATHIFARTEGNFQPVDIMNDILKKCSVYYEWPKFKLNNYYKRHVSIPKITGKGTMKREGGSIGSIGVIGADIWGVKNALSQCQLPSKGMLSCGREKSCEVISKIWDSIALNEKKMCMLDKYPCGKCLDLISNRIMNDINSKKVKIKDMRSDSACFIEKAEIRCQKLLKKY